MAPYYDMCKAAIKALKDRNGSSGAAIKKVRDLFMVIIIFRQHIIHAALHTYDMYASTYFFHRVSG